MNDLMKIETIAKLKLTTDTYLNHLNEQLDAVEDEDEDVQLNASALVKTIELTTNMCLVQSLEIINMQENINELLDIHNIDRDKSNE